MVGINFNYTILPLDNGGSKAPIPVPGKEKVLFSTTAKPGMLGLAMALKENFLA